MPRGRNTQQADEIHYCRDCAHVTPVMEFNTLTVHERLPTLGRCPYWTESRSILLSQRACGNFKKKV